MKQENGRMNSHDFVVIQTALRPMKVVHIWGTEYKAFTVADFPEFFDTMAKLPISKDTVILLNRGPGSYSGIRTGIAYVYGLVHGGMVSTNSIYSYTSFDIVKAATSHEGAIYLKSWPRVPNGKLTESKGYYLEHGKENLPIYTEWEKIADTKDLFIATEETLTSEFDQRTYADILEDANSYRMLCDKFESFPHTLEPLYINPVHIG